MLNWIKYTYQLKKVIKISLVILAFLIAGISIYFTSNLANELKQEEKKKIELWAEAMIAITDPSVNVEDISFYAKIITDNTTIPVILSHADGKLEARNLDSAVLTDSCKLRKKFVAMQQKNYTPILIDLGDGLKQTIYYDDSILLQKLKYYPIFQLGVVGLFLLISYLAFSYARRSEQNKVWVGLAKETAHQLGTPMSSLIAWIDLMEDDKSQANEVAFNEMRKDMNRLHIITERFSKIGSEPVLKRVDLIASLKIAIGYMDNRVSKNINIHLNAPDKTYFCNLNLALFDWVIENLIKNAIDAMPEGRGDIKIQLKGYKNQILIDVSDNGKGIHPSKFKTVFKPGFTTKKRGWGLGLSLVKRIIEEYHKGRIYVKESVLDKGTTFRIILPIEQ